MIVPYMMRLLCISLASFFLIHAALAMFTAILAPVAASKSGRMNARRAARFILAIRLFPAAAASLVVAVLCVPSFILLEPRTAHEGVGVACLLSAILGLSVWLLSFARSGRAITRSIQFARSSRHSATRTRVPGEVLPVWVMGESAPVPLALAGILHPHLVISRHVLNALAPDQLEVALRHEYAHHASRDNLKRLLLLLAPDPIPFVNPVRSLERQWARLAEWAADDAAVSGNAQRSLALATALVRVARACSANQRVPLVACLVGNGADLAIRIDRLLDPEIAALPQRRISQFRIFGLSAGAMLLLTGAALILAVAPPVLAAVHQVLEDLI